MKYSTIDKIDFSNGITALLPEKIRIRRSVDNIVQYEHIIYALLRHIPNVRFKKPNKKYKAVMDYVVKNISGNVYNVDDRGRWYVDCNGEKVYV